LTLKGLYLHKDGFNWLAVLTTTVPEEAEPELKTNL
jgi:hypothetical protein